jgi:SAM-dependent methyltransferase
MLPSALSTASWNTARRFADEEDKSIRKDKSTPRTTGDSGASSASWQQQIRFERFTPGDMERFRERRMKFFLRLVEDIPRPAQLLDVGGTTEFWKHFGCNGFSLTILNLFEQSPLDGAQSVTGDACNLSRFESGLFDVVFSNSVIGHVGGWERQQQMAKEIRRVGRRYFIQTPNHHFPVDWRTLVPFFHWLPPRVQAWFFQRLPVGAYKRAENRDQALNLATRVRNLRRSELKTLFPEANIVAERVAGMTKSFWVHHGFE